METTNITKNAFFILATLINKLLNQKLYKFSLGFRGFGVSEVTDWDTGSATEDTVVTVDMALADMALDMAMAVLAIMGRGRPMTMVIS